MDITGENEELFKSLIGLIRSANSLNALDIGFIRSINHSLEERSQNVSKSLLGLINTLVSKIDPIGSSVNGPLEDVNSVLLRWRSIEQVFELAIDKANKPPQNDRHLAAVNIHDVLKNSGAIPKPQTNFSKKVDNSVGPFKPLLTEKPFATKQTLEESLKINSPDEDHQGQFYNQPYEKEIRSATFPKQESIDFIGPKPDWDEVKCTLVSTPKQLKEMIAFLEQSTVIAVDVEHHDYRSYLGLVCLIQITARNRDFIVDPLSLWSEMQGLNRVFANPNIVKILHGARMDILWLQRDLGLYIVNLFDTFVASRLLGLPKHGLAYLLQKYADFHAQKQYQLADWRVRPLPQELIDYARADTHYLIYVYQQMRHELLKRDLWKQAITNSRDIAVRRFEKPGWNESEPVWLQTAIKYKLTGNVQRCCLVNLYDWRDRMAREHDESPRFIMTPQVMANLCIQRPTDKAGVLQSGSHLSSVIKENAQEIVDLLQHAQLPEVLAATDTIGIKQRPNTHALSTNPSADTTNSMLQNAEDLKAAESTLFSYSSKPVYELPQVDLGVIKWSDLQNAQRFQAVESDDEMVVDEDEEQKQEQVESDNEPKKEESGESSSESEPRNLKGRTLNIVQNSDNVEISREVEKNKARPKSTDEAFNFEEASQDIGQKLQESQDSRSYSRFRNFQQKGNKFDNNKFKKARSYRK